MTTILLVDDYTPSHRLLGFVLEQSGYTVTTAADGFQALERLTQMPIDLIITDLSMPKMDGLDLLEHVRDDKRYADTPVIMLTASIKEQDHVRATSVGVDVFLSKPIDSEELVAAVNQLVERRSASFMPFRGPLNLRNPLQLPRLQTVP